MGQHPPFPTLPCLADFAPLLRLFRGMTRKGPGSAASTREALAHCPLPTHPVVADFGCGSGASALILADALRVPVLALDGDGGALEDLWYAARARGLDPWIEPRCADMADPGLAPASLDLLWSEGAIAHLGWETALPCWRQCLKPQGLLALTDAAWLHEPPPEVLAQWQAWYPGIQDGAGNRARAEAHGFEVLYERFLPADDWWDYYLQVESSIRACEGEPDLAPVIQGLREEIAFYRHHGHHYSYQFLVLRRDSRP